MLEDIWNFRLQFRDCGIKLRVLLALIMELSNMNLGDEFHIISRDCVVFTQCLLILFVEPVGISHLQVILVHDLLIGSSFSQEV